MIKRAIKTRNEFLKKTIQTFLISTTYSKLEFFFYKMGRVSSIEGKKCERLWSSAKLEEEVVLPLIKSEALKTMAESWG